MVCWTLNVQLQDQRVNYWDKYTEMHGQQNDKIFDILYPPLNMYLIIFTCIQTSLARVQFLQQWHLKTTQIETI